MRYIRFIALAMLAVFAISAIAAASAEAKEGPFLKVCTAENGAKECTASERLKKGQSKKVTVEATEAFTLGTAVQKLKCSKLAGPATLTGSEVGTAGGSEEILTFTECTVEGNNKEGKECKVEKGEIKTNELINTLDKENQVATKGEKFLASFAPKTGKIFVTVKFTPAANCIIPETAIELGTNDKLGVAGTVDNEKQEALQLEIIESFGVSGLLKFPTPLLKTEWVEEGKVVSEVKEGLVAFGKAVTSFTGHAKLTLEGTGKQWGVFGK